MVHTKRKPGYLMHLINALIACWLNVIFASYFPDIGICSAFCKSSDADLYLYSNHS